MKGILINAKDKKIEEIEVDGISSMEKAIGGYTETAKMFPAGDALIVDEEGRLKKPPYGFILNMPDSPSDMVYVGNGLIIGSARRGSFSDAKSDIEVVKSSVRFLEKKKTSNYAAKIIKLAKNK